jgi:hypothetical protein
MDQLSDQLAAMPPLLEVPGMRVSLMWGIGCGSLGVFHRLRQGRGPLLSASRGVACFGAAFAVSWFAETRALARTQALQQRFKDALRRSQVKQSQAARPPAASAVAASATAAAAAAPGADGLCSRVEYTDTDGDRICFRIDARSTQLVYEVSVGFSLALALFSSLFFSHSLSLSFHCVRSLYPPPLNIRMRAQVKGLPITHRLTRARLSGKR